MTDKHQPAAPGAYATGRHARSTMSLAEIAGELGHDAEWISRRNSSGRRRWQCLIEQEGMPAPLSSQGHPRFDRASFFAWKGRHHPLAPKGHANDAAAIPAPASDAAARRHLAEVYGASRG